ncbi:hypothetical protein [Absidia glauca]|uniref:Uncharacterized protein n=1 Tax=Absidia glauca TaxID=4829 RepID=A0A163JTV7_ABSGL|nr:hypothetical protein [Absidia glauca]
MTTNRPKLQHRSSSSSSQNLADVARKPASRNEKARSQSLKTQSLIASDQHSRRPSSPVMSSVPRLSIADRFMSTSGYQHSPMTSSPLSNVSSPIVTEDSIKTTTLTSNSARATIHAIDSTPNASRLTIADTFMKSSSSLLSSTSASSSVKQKESTAITGTIHPLDNLTEPAHRSLDLNLELLTPPPTSRSPSLYRTDNYSRPFGSQDTLVSSDLLANSKQQPLQQPDQGHGEEKDSNAYYQVSLDDYYQPPSEEDERHENDSDFSSTTRLGEEENDQDLQQHKSNIKNQQQQNQTYDTEEKGYWIGCCYLSCGGQQRRKTSSSKPPPPTRRCGRRWRVFGLFLATLLIIVLSSIFWPRTPLIRIEGASLLSPAKITTTNQGAMVGNVQFESQWMVNFTVDNRQNWVLPTRLVQWHVIVKDVLTGNVIGKGLQNDHPESMVLDPRAISTVQLGISLDYQARDVSDTTFASLKKACVPSPALARRDEIKGSNNTVVPTGTANQAVALNNNSTAALHPVTPPPPPPSPPPSLVPQSAKEHESLSLLFWITLHIWGLDFFGYRPTVLVTSATGGFVCPLL